MKGFFLAIFIFNLLVLPGCISNTVITTSEPGAEISVGKIKSKEPSKLEYHDREPFWGGADILVQKSGCASHTFHISKTDEFSPEGFFLGFITYGLGFLWVGTYLPSYQLDYHCDQLTEAGKL